VATEKLINIDKVTYD